MWKTQTTQSNVDKAMETELNRLDDLYIHAYETRSITMMKQVSKPEFLYKLSRIAALRPRYFSDKQYRNNTWEVISIAGALYTIRKLCTYQQVRLGSIRKVKIATDYSEIWQVLSQAKTLIIVDIKEENE